MAFEKANLNRMRKEQYRQRAKKEKARDLIDKERVAERGKKKTIETFRITNGKIPTELQKMSGDLSWTIEEGYSDQQIMFHAVIVEDEIKKLRGKLKEVMGYKEAE
jgi:hypothetical protein